MISEINDVFELDLIKIKYFALDKKSCLSEMADHLAEKGIISSSEIFFRSIWERENIMSTGIGKAVAIPHSRSEVVEKFRILVYLLDNELEFDSIDEVPVRIIFMIAVPEELKSEYMKVLSMISNFFRNEENRQGLLGCNSMEDVYNILKGIEL